MPGGRANESAREGFPPGANLRWSRHESRRAGLSMACPPKMAACRANSNVNRVSDRPTDGNCLQSPSSGFWEFMMLSPRARKLKASRV